jgi:hypothetical protein
LLLQLATDLRRSKGIQVLIGSPNLIQAILSTKLWKVVLSKDSQIIDIAQSTCKS